MPRPVPSFLPNVAYLSKNFSLICNGTAPLLCIIISCLSPFLRII
ncbi:hypothetical protein MCHI_000268 [Candidatus Magnetoovum chiemensis]|nr:hypothetical protein MCHI_000268 [Candidatus Magnetoovum chiemensis]